MENVNLAEVRVLVGEADKRIQTGVKYALQSMGFKNIEIAMTYEAIESAISADGVDLLLTETEVPGGEVCELMQKIRVQDVGENPFLVAIAMTDPSDEDAVKNVLNAGFDDLIVKPLSSGNLTKRISRVVTYRKPFVVTFDYTGPDRRSKKRASTTQSVPLIRVPNPIQAQIDGEYRTKAFREKVDRAKKILKDQKAERLSNQITWLIERIMPSCMDDTLSAETIGYLGSVSMVAKQVLDFISDTPFATEDVTFTTADAIAETIRANSGRPVPEQFDQLHQVARLIKENILPADMPQVIDPMAEPVPDAKSGPAEQQAAS